MNTTSKKVSKPQAYFMLIFGIAMVIVGFMVTEDADAVILLAAGAVLSTLAVFFGTKYSDIQIINPSLFFFLACLICAVMALIMGSSWGTISAVGIDIIDTIILRGGLSSFLEIAAILISACVFGAPLRAAGVVDALLDLITTTSKSARSMASKVFATCLTCLINITFTGKTCPVSFRIAPSAFHR